MRTLRKIAARLRGMFGHERAGRELSDELESHCEMFVEDAMRRGLSEEEARRNARLDLGGFAQAQDAYREQRGLPVVENLVRDAAYSFRLLGKSRMFAAVAVLSLALGIGANTAMFSLVNAVLLRPLPYAEPDRLLHSERDVTMDEFAALREQRSLFRDVGGMQWGAERRIDFQGHPEWVNTQLVTPGYFRTLGVGMWRGNEFREGSGERSVILSYPLWQRIGGGREDAVGQAVQLDGVAYTVIGVTGPDLWLPEMAEAFVPLRSTGTVNDMGANTQVIARLSGATSSEVRHQNVRLIGLRQWIAGDVRGRLLLLLAAVGVVLLIACFNLAGLLLARLSTRQREISVRLALGSGRGRLLQQLLVENVIVCVMGGAVGVIGAYWVLESFVALLPFRVTTAGAVGLDARVLAFSLLLTMAAAVMVSVGPAWIAGRINLQDVLRQSARGAGEKTRLRGLLVAGEVAAATALLAGAAILIEGLYRVGSQPLGFRPDGLLTFYAPPERGLDAARRQSRPQMFQEQLATIPGVRSVAAANVLPLVGKNNFPAQRAGHPEQSIGGMEIRVVTSNYMETMGVRLVQGRGFAERDNAQAPPAVLINEALARVWWQGGGAVGDRVDIGWFRGKPLMPETTREVIGVVADMKTVAIAEPARPTLFLPVAQAGWYGGGMHYVVRSDSAATLVDTVRRKVMEIAPGQRLQRMTTMERIVMGATSNPRFDAVIFGCFAFAAVSLAMLGIYGVLGYAVARRTSEIGTRMALGASRGEVLRLILRQGLGLVALGLACGLPAAWWIGRYAAALAPRVTLSSDVSRLIVITLLVAGVGVLASLLPARRATRIDPISALRCD